MMKSQNVDLEGDENSGWPSCFPTGLGCRELAWEAPLNEGSNCRDPARSEREASAMTGAAFPNLVA